MDRAKFVHNTLKNLLQSSTQIALRDGQITTDEAKLLKILAEKLVNIEHEILSIVDILDEELDEEKIDKRVRLVARDILPSLTQVAEKDGIITSDEAAILARVLSEIM